MKNYAEFAITTAKTSGIMVMTMHTKETSKANNSQATRVDSGISQSKGQAIHDYVETARKIDTSPERIKENAGYIRDANGSRIKLNDPPKRQTRGSLFSLKQKF